VRFIGLHFGVHDSEWERKIWGYTENSGGVNVSLGNEMNRSNVLSSSLSKNGSEILECGQWGE